MIRNPYEPPTTNVEVIEPELVVPPEIASKIRNSWVAGLLSIAFTILFVIISFFGTSILGIDEWALIDAAFMAGLCYGVYKKSRTCAILLLAFFGFSKAVMWVDSGSVSGLPMTLVFLWFFFQGVVGTFQFHRWKSTAYTAENA